ncbi:MAG TPA: protein kinase, partial [Labilithrix sp.]|nr:protein kinase [Labilithrix sp.]
MSLLSGERIGDLADFGLLRPGMHLGRYELLVPVAQGGMASVWAARQRGPRGFHKLVAIKTILPHLAEDHDFEQMFLDEARIASGVHHPNVCQIYELGEEDKTLYLAMEWVSGESFARVLRATGTTQALDPRVVARIVADACAGVHAAHEMTDDAGRPLSVVHRDLSPHNVLLSADGVVKVCDFGVAKALGQLHETNAGQIKGRLSYMAPEQVFGRPVDRRSDVFAMGCVLYEATTGTKPFRGDQDHIILQAISKGEFAAPTRVVPGYPQELERIVVRALGHHPSQRFPTAESMRFALEEFLTRGPLVTQSNVAQVVRSRVGDRIEQQRERIRRASAMDEQGGEGLAPAREAVEDRSGVKSSKSIDVPESLPPTWNGRHRSHASMVAVSGPATRPSGESLDLPIDGVVEPTLLLDNDEFAGVGPSDDFDDVDDGPTLHDPVLPASPASTPTIPEAPAARVPRVVADDRPFPSPVLAPPMSSAPFTQDRRMSERPRPPSPSILGGAALAYGGGLGPAERSPSMGPSGPTSLAASQGADPYAATAVVDVAQSLPEAVAIASARKREGRAGRYLLAAVIALFVAVLAGGGGYFFLKSRKAQVSATPTAPSPEAPSPEAP